MISNNFVYNLFFCLFALGKGQNFVSMFHFQYSFNNKIHLEIIENQCVIVKVYQLSENTTP